MNKKKRMLITGANGFLGAEIAAQALVSGWNVLATDKGPAPKVSGIEYFSADILDPNSLLPNLVAVDVVIHAAGRAHIHKKANDLVDSFHSVNEVGTANVARVAAEAGVGHFVHVSSVSVYGGSSDGGSEELKCCPQGPYAESKYQGELRAMEIARVTGMPLTILRLVTLYGEGDPGNVGRLLHKIDNGSFFWIGNGSNKKSLLYHADAARACLLVAERSAAGTSVYNVSSYPCTMREVVTGLSAALEKRDSLIGIPVSIARGIAGILSVLPMYRSKILAETIRKWLADEIYDGRKFAREFSFRALIDLREGLRREVTWHRNSRQSAKNHAL